MLQFFPMTVISVHCNEFHSSQSFICMKLKQTVIKVLIVFMHKFTGLF